MKFNFRAGLAITLAVLMATGIVAPAAATTGQPQAPTAVDAPSTTLPDDRSALGHRLAAYRILEAAGEARELDHLNATLEHVVDADRIDARSVFHDDRLVVARTQVNHTEAAEHLVASDRDLAETALADARRVRDQLDRRNHSYNETAVDDYLANASEDLQEGHAHVEADELVAAVEAYQRAWTAANRALDVLQRAVDPQVTITRRADPPHDGNLTYSIEGTVWTVRSHEMNASLTVNGQTHNLTLQASTVPGENATFARRIELDQQVTRINVSVSNPVSYVDYDRVGDRPLDDDAPPGDGGPPDNSSDDDSSSEVQIGFDVLKLDGDGLPDHYEEDVVGTDPLGPDSDSRFTDADEADQGLLDGAKDFSGDRLTTYQEYRIGSDPLVNDTTGDGLGDGFQVLRAATDPTVNDTDGDGVPDTEEDLTGDGLTLAEEQRHGVHPLVNDTDGDGLGDYAEIHEYDTDPLDPDVDGDNLTDGQEIQLGLDPTDPDTDGNGVPDGEETFTTTTADEASGVEVAATGEGAVADEISVLHVTPPNETRANASGIEGATTEAQFAVGPTVRIQNDTDFDELAVTIPIDEDVELASTGVKVYRWDPATDEGWVPVETEIDRRNRTATATVTSTGYFAAFDAAAWENATTATAKPGWPALEQFEDLDGWRGDGRLENDKLVVGSGGDTFSVVDFKAPDRAAEGDTITIEAKIENTGDRAGTQTVAYVFSGSEIAFETVELEPAEQHTVQFQVNPFEDHPDLAPLSRSYDHGVVTDDDRWNATITFFDDDDGGSAEPEFEVTNFEARTSVDAGEVITVTAELTNTGGARGETNVTYYFDGAAGETRNKTVDPGETVPVRFRVQVPLLIDEGYHDHWITANRSGDSDGDEIYVDVDEDPTLIFPILSQDSATPQICLPGGDSSHCSITAALDSRLASGHYGAASAGLASGREPAGPNGASTDAVVNGSDESAASRGIVLPDAESIPVQVRVRAETDGEGDRAEIVLKTDRETVTLFSRANGTSTSRWVTVRADVSRLAGKDAELVVRTEGDARIEVDYVSVMADSTGSGIPDQVEAMDLRMPSGPPGVRGTPLNLDQAGADTAGDGLPDYEQVDVEWEIVREGGAWQIQAGVIDAVAHPSMADSDADGISDSKELEGWTVAVVNKSGGDNPYRWYSDKGGVSTKNRGTMLFDSNPFLADTDGDGVDDGDEKEVLHTDPRQERTYGVTATREALLRGVYEEWKASSKPDYIAKSAVAMNLVSSLDDETDHGDNIVAPPGDMEELRNAELTDATDDFDFVVKQDSAGPLERFLYETPDEVTRTDVWLSNGEELSHSKEPSPWVADSDDDGLTDGQEVHGVTIVSEVSDPALFTVTVEENYELDPTNPDSDNDDALDGGGYYLVTDHRLGQRVTNSDPFIEQGEVFDLPTDPTYADVVEMVVAADEEFRSVHVNRNGGYRGFIRDVIKTSEYHLNRQLDEPIYFAIVKWLEVTSDGQWEEEGYSPEEQLEKIERSDSIGWGDPGKTPSSSTDVLSVFSHQRMGPDDDNFWTELVDGVAPHKSRSLIVGTKDISYKLSEQHRELDATYHIYQHELGHVFDAVHPPDGPDDIDDINGVMCKMSCLTLWDRILIPSRYVPGEENTDVAGELHERDWMLGTHDWADYNIKRIEDCRGEVPLYDKDGDVCW